jgi:hypothetical protein
VNSGNGTVTLVQAVSTVPSMSCPAVTNSETTVWVGIDGATNVNRSLEQDGYEAVCSNNIRTPIYYSWTEMLPKNEQPSPVIVRPGDQLAMKVWYNPANQYYGLQLVNRTLFNQNNGKSTSQDSYTRYSKCASNKGCLNGSAEWIVERITYIKAQTCYLYPFVNFTNISFNAADLMYKSSLIPIGNVTNTPEEITQKVPITNGKYLGQTYETYPMYAGDSSFTVNENFVGSTEVSKC